MKIDKKMYYITLTVISFLIFLAMVVIWENNDNSHIAGSCNINGIRLVNVTPDKCWNDDFSKEHCPIPEQIDCSFDVDGLASIFKKLTKDI